ncbi:MAG TPA: hypothetical protein VGE62_01060 [Candidatus Paceibacterota bacterium]
MKKKFIYRDKKTGKKIYSDVPITDPNLVLVKQVRDGQMKGNNIVQK